MDRPVDEIAVVADQQIEKGFTIWQKWTCSNCGSRQTMEEPNTLYRSGTCQACGELSAIVVCGFMAATGAFVDALAQDLRDA